MEKEISSELDVELKLDKDSGRLEIIGEYEGKLGGAKVSLFTDAAKLIDKLTDIIPGQWDDELLDGLAQKLLSKKTGE